ncbi:hypothetical protein [Nafulsella turpanensis]|uniref:hypothetical protein n=1 Tax=Nafulsella turpanensis TaxID=1265690 RepID=UPI0003609763|nr:hypothetical protein [Nafulsella turpanensis]
MNKKLKIIGYYFFALASLIGFYYLDNSADLVKFQNEANSYRVSTGFAFLAIVGLIKYSLLIIGLAIPVILTWMLIRENKRNAL